MVITSIGQLIKVIWLKIFSSIQSLSRVQLFATPWTTAHQASLSITNSRSLLKLMSIGEKAASPHSSTLAWKIPWMEEPGGLQSKRSHKVGRDWSDLAAAACPLSQWCHPAISSSVIPFSSRLQSFPASESFQMSQFFAGGQSIGVSTSASVLPVNIQDWFSLGWTGWISLQSKGLSSLQHHSSRASVLQHSAFFIVQLSHPYMTTGKTIALTMLAK